MIWETNMMTTDISIPETMTGVLLTGHGGFNKLELRRDLPVPEPDADEVLIRVKAAGVNNTDINTRIGWYSRAVGSDTGSGGAQGIDGIDAADAGWSGAMTFPRIQGADACGEIVAVGTVVDKTRIGERVLVAAIQPRHPPRNAVDVITFGSECDGAFAQYTKARADQTFKVDCALSDAELASFPCAYSTAENMLHRAGCAENERVLVTGASGGVGSAVVQLARQRGAHVAAVTSREKEAQVRALGADTILDRDADPGSELGGESVDLVVDLVAGQNLPNLVACLKRGGRYTVAGAIAGPRVTLDVRDLYLKDLTFFGATAQSASVFKNLVGYIERGEIKPLVAATYPLDKIAEAQQAFLDKKFVGKIVLLPD